MSTNYSLSAGFTDMWAREVHLAFQQKTSQLREACQTANCEGSHTYRFPVLAAGSPIINKSPFTTLVPNASALSVAIATMQSVSAYRLIDSIEQVQTTADARTAYSTSVVNEISRGLDDLIIAAVDATTNDGTSSLPTANTLNVGGLAEMSDLLSLNNVPLDDERYAIISVGGNKDIATDSTLVSDLFVQKGVVESGQAKFVMGFNMIMSNRTLVPSAGKHNNYFWSKSAVGLAFAMDINFRVDFRPDIDGWGLLAKLVAGAVIIDPTGVYKAAIAD